MAPIPEVVVYSFQWMPVALGVLLTACVAMSIALIVLLCGAKKEEKDQTADAPPVADESPPPTGEAAAAEQPKETSKKEEPVAGGSTKPAPLATTRPSVEGQELKLTSEKPATSAIGGKSAKGPAIDLKKQPSLQLQAATAKK